MPTIDIAVSMRAISAFKQDRERADALFERPGAGSVDTEKLIADCEAALYFSFLLTYAQGLHQLAEASETYGYELDLATVARIWRAGCIIRSALLDDIATAFRGDLPHGELILAPAFTETLGRTLPALRAVVGAAVAQGHAVPVLSAALQWADTMRQGFGTANIIQAQRDYFGHHGFERLGQAGQHHGPWWD